MNMEKKHTQKEWKLSRPFYNEIFKDQTHSQMPVIGIDSEEHDGHIMVFGDGGEEHKADAKLAAAAPKMLRALIRFTESYKEANESGDWGQWNLEDDEPYMDAIKAIKDATE